VKLPPDDLRHGHCVAGHQRIAPSGPGETHDISDATDRILVPNKFPVLHRKYETSIFSPIILDPRGGGRSDNTDV
jgi:hypothetical protein